MHQQLLQAGVKYYLRNGSFEGDLDESLTGRFVCSWSTTKKDMEELSAVVKKLIY
jgi:threonine aldolase